MYVQEGADIGPLDVKYCGPYRVLVRERKKILLEIGASQTRVSVDRLKLHSGAETTTVAQPPTRGWPCKTKMYYFVHIVRVVCSPSGEKLEGGGGVV